MGMERLPSGKYKVNKAFLRMGMPAHNMLKVISRDMVMERALGLERAILQKRSLLPPRALTMHKSHGFTIMEMIVVIILLGILAVVAVFRIIDTGAEAAGEAELLKANLRFVQARAMSEGLEAEWGVRIESDSYSLIKDGALSSLRFPGGDSPTHTLSTKTSITGGTGDLTFDFFGRPLLNDSVLTANHVITFSGGKSVTVTAETGFIP